MYITCIFFKPQSLAPPLAASASCLAQQENQRILNVSFLTKGLVLYLTGSSMGIDTINKLE